MEGKGKFYCLASRKQTPCPPPPLPYTWHCGHTKIIIFPFSTLYPRQPVRHFFSFPDFHPLLKQFSSTVPSGTRPQAASVVLGSTGVRVCRREPRPSSSHYPGEHRRPTTSLSSLVFSHALSFPLRKYSTTRFLLQKTLYNKALVIEIRRKKWRRSYATRLLLQKVECNKAHVANIGEKTRSGFFVTRSLLQKPERNKARVTEINKQYEDCNMIVVAER